MQTTYKPSDKLKKQLLEQGIEYDTIDWASYSDDVPIEDYLKNEYHIVLSDYDDIAEGMQNVKEKEAFHKFIYPESVNWKDVSKKVKSPLGFVKSIRFDHISKINSIIKITAKYNKMD